MLEQVDLGRKRASSNATSPDSFKIPSVHHTAKSGPQHTLEVGIESRPNLIGSERHPIGVNSSLRSGERSESPERPAAISQLLSSDRPRAGSPESGQECHKGHPLASSDFGHHYSAAASSAHLQVPSSTARGHFPPWPAPKMTLKEYEALTPAQRGEVLTNGHRPREDTSTASGNLGRRGSFQQQAPTSLIKSIIAVFPHRTLNSQTREQMAETRIQQPRGDMPGSEKMSARLGFWVQRGKKGWY